jgi:hypothetical protein
MVGLPAKNNASPTGVFSPLFILPYSFNAKILDGSDGVRHGTASMYDMPSVLVLTSSDDNRGWYEVWRAITAASTCMALCVSLATVSFVDMFSLMLIKLMLWLTA